MTPSNSIMVLLVLFIAFLTTVTYSNVHSNLRGSNGGYGGRYGGRKNNADQSNRVNMDHSHIKGPTTIKSINNLIDITRTTEQPTEMSTEMPTEMPTETAIPTTIPTGTPSTATPTIVPTTATPTDTPTTAVPTTAVPTETPTTAAPTEIPTPMPTFQFTPIAEYDFAFSSTLGKCEFAADPLFEPSVANAFLVTLSISVPPFSIEVENISCAVTNVSSGEGTGRWVIHQTLNLVDMGPEYYNNATYLFNTFSRDLNVSIESGAFDITVTVIWANGGEIPTGFDERPTDVAAKEKHILATPTQAPTEELIEIDSNEVESLLVNIQDPPSFLPTELPTDIPTEIPTTAAPTEIPSFLPTPIPGEPTIVPTTALPTKTPSSIPTEAPTTAIPTTIPSESPTRTPTTAIPTNIPTESPSETPSAVPTTATPTELPTESPSETPSAVPTEVPTDSPSETPTESPSETPSVVPTETPTESPSETPTESPSETPSAVPTYSPSETPTTAIPTETPTTTIPTEQPTEIPTELPSTAMPTAIPTEAPPPSGNAFCGCSDIRTEVAERVSLITGRVWMDRNLGASRNATSYDDYFAFGCTFQWGRAYDGHASVLWTSLTNGTGVTGNVTGPVSDPYPVCADGEPYVIDSLDWLAPPNDTLWETGSPRDPCPEGYQVPSEAEWEAEALSGVDGYYAYDQLGLTGAGLRTVHGIIAQQGQEGYYWTRTPVAPPNSVVLRLSIFLNYIGTGDRANGLNVRCIKTL